MRDKVKMHLCGKLSSKELRLWSEKAYHEFLIKDFLIVDKIYMYPFISVFSKIDIIPDDENDIFPCSERELESAFNVLSGQESYLYQFRLTIPWELNILNIYKDKFYLYSSLKGKICRLDDEGCEQLSIPLLCSGKSETVLNMLEFRISGMLSRIEDGGIIRELYHSNMNSYGSKKLKDIILPHLDCFLGKRGMIVETSYVNGDPSINIYPEL